MIKRLIRFIKSHKDEIIMLIIFISLYLVIMHEMFGEMFIVWEITKFFITRVILPLYLVTVGLRLILWGITGYLEALKNHGIIVKFRSPIVISRVKPVK